MNKYGISYQVFDGVELLEDSINQIKEFVDHISVIFQTESYWGTKLTEKEIEIVKSLKERNIIDELIFFTDKSQPKLITQVNKRNLGRKISKDNGCTHYMSMDCDEFYTKNALKKLIEYHDNNPNNVSYMPIRDYYKDTKYCLIPNDYKKGGLYVSGFFPVDNVIIPGYPLNLKVDPTRKPNISDISRIKKWDVDEIRMQHMCYLRANIYKKVFNACAKQGYGNKLEHFKYLTECYNNYETNKIAVSAVGPKYNIIEIEPLIILDKYYDNIKEINK